MDFTCVFIVQHSRHISSDREDVKLIGVYGSQEKAQEAVDRLRLVEGFRDNPNGFSSDRYIVDQDHWTDGFESPRLSRRLHHLREWSHGKYVKEIFS